MTEKCGKHQKGNRTSEGHQRINFLHQASIAVSMQSSQVNDCYAKISRQMVKNIREVLNVDRVQIEPDMRRFYCKKCYQVLIAKANRIEVNRIQKKIIERKCLLCGQSSKYQWNPNYLSRNGKGDN